MQIRVQKEASPWPRAAVFEAGLWRRGPTRGDVAVRDRLADRVEHGHPVLGHRDRHELGHHAALSTDNLRYKLSRGEWDGADPYEAIAFAEAYRAPRGLILRSRKPGVPAAAALAVARSRSTRVTWVADPAVDPADAASAVADEAVEWVGEGLQLLSA